MAASQRAETLYALYRAFNDRDIETVLAAMTPDVDWPNGWEGGRLVGHDSVRRYWERQWAQIRPRVNPVAICEHPDGSVEVTVRQVVRDPTGSVLFRGEVRHTYHFVGDLVSRMDTHP